MLTYDEIELKIKQLKREISMLEKHQLDIRTTDKDALPIADYVWTPEVKIGKGGQWHDDIPEGVEYVQFKGVWTNEADFEAFILKYGQLDRSIVRDKYSLKYYRISDVLMGAGGGSYVVKTKIVCANHEWEAIKRGNIPERLKHAC